MRTTKCANHRSQSTPSLQDILGEDDQPCFEPKKCKHLPNEIQPTLAASPAINVTAPNESRANHDEHEANLVVEFDQLVVIADTSGSDANVTLTLELDSTLLSISVDPESSDVTIAAKFPVFRKLKFRKR